MCGCMSIIFSSLTAVHLIITTSLAAVSRHRQHQMMDNVDTDRVSRRGKNSLLPQPLQLKTIVTEDNYLCRDGRRCEKSAGGEETSDHR